MLEQLGATSAIDRSTRHPEETRELAYQLWAFVSSRSAKEVARLLSTEEYGGLDVPARTVQHWVQEHKWADRVDKDIHAIAPDLRYQAFSELLFAGLEGAKYIRRVAAGKEDEPDISDLPETDDPIVKFDRIMARVKSHDAARKARLSASVSAVDRIGFSPVGKGAPGVELPAGDEETTPDFATMSVEELRVWREQAKRRRKR